MDQGAVRNLDQIQETDDVARMPRVAGLALLVAFGACLAFGASALRGRAVKQDLREVDPLGDLVLQQQLQTKARPATQLTPQDVTFPGLLSDEADPTTALAAVRNPLALHPTPAVAPSGVGASMTTPVVSGAPTAPPPAEDRLPVMMFAGREDRAAGAAMVPLPAQNLLEASPVVTRPRDPLTRAAVDSAHAVVASTPAAAAGHDGGYQLQVSSFHTDTEASDFASELRARGHKAYVLEAKVDGRGTWYRVRIGPFPTQGAAAAYRASFEVRAHVVPFLIPPPRPTTDH